MTAPEVKSTLKVRLDAWFMIADKVDDPEYKERRSLIGWCHVHKQPYPVWMNGPVQYLRFPYTEREQVLCRLNTRWRDRKDPGEYDNSPVRTMEDKGSVERF